MFFLSDSRFFTGIVDFYDNLLDPAQHRNIKGTSLKLTLCEGQVYFKESYKYIIMVTARNLLTQY